MKLTVEQINLSLNLPHQKQNAVLVDLEKEFLKHFQDLLDLFYEATKVTKTNKLSEIAKKLLFSRLINNLIFSYYALMRGFQTECYTLLRADLEILDLINLFHKKPELSVLWFVGDKEAKETFKHSNIKKEVGKKYYDFLYPEISRMGTHPTYFSTRFLTPESANEEARRITIFIGGHHKESESYICGTFYLLACLYSFLEMSRIYKIQINEQEYLEKMADFSRDFLAFNGKYLSLITKKEDRKSFEKYSKKLEEILKDIPLSKQ